MEITVEIFMLAVLAVSLFTGLVTEAVKKILDEKGGSWSPNTAAGIIAVILAAALTIGYAVYFGVPVTAQLVVLGIALAFLSWLCAMVGYDKVIQAITQFKERGD